MAPKLLYGGGAPKSSLYGGGSQGNVYRPGMGGQPGPGIGGQPGPGIDQMTGGGMEDNMPFWFRAKAAKERREKKDTGYKRRKRTGNPLGDEYQRAWDDARIENEERYEDILQGYKGRYRRGMEAMEGSEQLVKDRYLKERGNIRQDMTSRGLSGMTSIQTAQGIANRAQQLGIQDIRRDRAELDARLSEDVLGFKKDRTDAYPDFGNMAALAQGLGEYGGGGYGGRKKKKQIRKNLTPNDYRAIHRANMDRMAAAVKNQPGSQHNPLTWERDSHTGAIKGGSRGSRPQDVPTRQEALQAVGQLSQSDFVGPGYLGMRGPRRINRRQQQMNPMQQLMMMMMAMQNQNRGGGGGPKPPLPPVNEQGFPGGPHMFDNFAFG